MAANSSSTLLMHAAAAAPPPLHVRASKSTRKVSKGYIERHTPHKLELIGSLFRS
jgi:hypothetical protein